jgi:mycothiol system anti-sigma-R factor
VSCGKPHATPCSEVLDHLYEFIDGELESGDLAKFRHHLDECAPCLREYGVEAEVRSLIRRACCCGHAPKDLRERVLMRIRQISVELRYQGP